MLSVISFTSLWTIKLENRPQQRVSPPTATMSIVASLGAICFLCVRATAYALNETTLNKKRGLRCACRNDPNPGNATQRPGPRCGAIKHIAGQPDRLALPQSEGPTPGDERLANARCGLTLSQSVHRQKGWCHPADIIHRGEWDRYTGRTDQ